MKIVFRIFEHYTRLLLIHFSSKYYYKCKIFFKKFKTSLPTLWNLSQPKGSLCSTFKQKPTTDMIQKHPAQAVVTFYLKTCIHKAATGGNYEYAQLHAKRY